MTESIPLLIDTDPGVDDALALLMAFNDTRHEIVGLTIAAGNVGLQHTVRNALKLCEVVGADVPVFAGCAAPLLHPARDAAYVHGLDGFGDIGYPAAQRSAEAEHAALAILRLSHAHAGRLLLVAPNIVHAERELEADPSDFRLWVCLHEETHRVQFTAVPWMRDHLQAQVDTLVEGVDVDPAKMAAMLGDALKRAGDLVTGRGETSLVDLFATPAQREVIDRVTTQANSPKAATMRTLGAVLAAWEATSGVHTWRSPGPWDRAVMDALIGWGYPASDVEQLLVAPDDTRTDDGDEPTSSPDDEPIEHPDAFLDATD